MSYEIIKGNALDLPLADASVDLVVTSPPYFGLRSYQDGGKRYGGQIGAEATPAEFVGALLAATEEAVRVLKPSGSLWVNLGDRYSTGNSGQSGMSALGKKYSGGGHSDSAAKQSSRAIPGMRPKSLVGVPWRYALQCVDDLGLILRAEVIWTKPNGMPESVTDRVRRQHETWFHFTKNPCYFANLDAVREPHADVSLARAGRARDTAYDAPGSTPNKRSETVPNPLGRLPGSVRSVSTQPLRPPAELGIKHFAAFPVEWPRWIIAGWCPEGGTVLDPFGGTGTTALVADVMGCHGITVDLSSDYCRLAEWRINDPKERAKVLKRMNA